MTTARTLDLHSLAAMAREYYQLLVEIQDARRIEPERNVPERLRQIAERARAYADEQALLHPRLSQTLQRLGERAEALRRLVASGAPLRATATRAAAQHYEALARLLRSTGRDEGIELPELKPRNYVRNAFHIGNGLLGATLYTVWPERRIVLTVALIYSCSMIFMELIRRTSPKINAFMVDRLFGAIARPVEAHRVNSATWFGVAIVIMLWLFPAPACIAAVLILGCGDPVAAIVGRRWGKHKLVGNKTLEGALGFVVAATAATTVFLVATGNPAVQRGDFLHTVLFAGLLAVVASVAGALAELASSKVDDNFSIPLVSAWAAWLVLPG